MTPGLCRPSSTAHRPLLLSSLPPPHRLPLRRRSIPSSSKSTDGAGRVGKMLYSRQGKKFDYDLKQLRFASDLLMELGAGLELATSAVPHLFLPLACVANVAKNVGVVTSKSTRTPIYKAYAKGENIGDVTAKGERVGNIADLVASMPYRKKSFSQKA